MLLQKSDGSYYLALWREESVWDNQSRTPQSAASGSVKLSFADTFGAPKNTRRTAPASRSAGSPPAHR